MSEAWTIWLTAQVNVAQTRNINIFLAYSNVSFHWLVSPTDSKFSSRFVIISFYDEIKIEKHLSDSC